jgi:hypothetical protein
LKSGQGVGGPGIWVQNMDEADVKPESLGDLLGAKELLQLVLKKLASQALVFGFGVILIVVVLGWIFRSDPAKAVPLILAVLFVFFVAFVGYLFAEQRGKAASGDPATANQVLGNKMKTIENKAETFSVRVWADPAGSAPPPIPAGARDIKVVPAKSDYTIGDKVVVRFRSNRDCHLTLLNVGTSGKLTILFPNALHRDNAIQANRDYEIPGPDYGFEYELQGPPGVEKLKAVATVEKVELLESSFDADGGFFRTVAPATGARDIAIVQKKVAALPADRWAESSFEFRVR